MRATKSNRFYSRGIWRGVSIFAASFALLAHAAEPWADSKLTITNGIEIWLDASRQNAARQIRQLPALTGGRPVDLWFDASGNHFDLAQTIPEARPHFQTASGLALVRFDGKDDFLAAINLRRAFTNATIFIVAAPRSNVGAFRALLAGHENGRNDYTSGFNVDQSVSASSVVTLNAEGAGFQGAQNLFPRGSPFGSSRVMTLVCEPGAKGVRLFVDGTEHGARARAASVLRMDEFTVGARCYSNTAEPPHAQGFFDGDIAEIILFNRALPDTERGAIENYLMTKYAVIRLSAAESPAPPDARPLELVTNAPPVQMIVPGFNLRPLPLALNNINNLKYRADGKLVALGYNGRIYLLSDTDGDGLEDKAEIFWDRDTLHAPIGMALTPPGYSRGDGVFVAAKGKLALILDRDRDGRADEEIVVAEGWPGIWHNVDALGVAVDRAGNIYFGLGAANYTDAYLIDKATGQSRYDLKSERGTILKVSPDFSHREIFCTGIRFPVAIAINRTGDLFCTDQEGATWLPNGNPFDELLHLESGRHYGFPPRHPRHLPNVVDEPSAFDFAPQHQSTCGLNFNESINGGPTFGPAWWAGDAIVTGESRGKIWHTRLTKTPAGYVAQNRLIACLNMLTVDACVSPRGDLMITCHSGKPDWGSGPTGDGKLFQVRYTATNAPQPALVWQSSPTEFRIAFDRPLDPSHLRNVAKYSAIIRGQYVQPGDRFETMRPGYQVVQDQLAVPRREVPVHSASISADHRTLSLATAPQSAAMNYAITLPATIEGAAGPDIEVLGELTGVEAQWQSQTGAKQWNGWLPHFDLQVARQFTVGSAEHDRFWELLKKPGKLILRGQLDLWKMLQPAVQPGATLDYVPTAENVVFEFRGDASLTVKVGRDRRTFVTAEGQRKRHTTEISPASIRWEPVEITLATGGALPVLECDWRIGSTPRAFPLRRILLPWASPKDEAMVTGADRKIPELAGGNWIRGRRIFFSESAACSKCHAVRGEGGKIGPDLSNLIYRDYASVLRDIREPSAAINPDHVAWQVELKDADTITGVLVADATDRVTLADATGQSITLPRTRIASMKPSPLSLMPEGLDKVIGEAALKDLLTFLLTSPLEPALLEAPNPPPPRRRREFETVLKSSIASGSTAASLNIVLCAGPKDHGPGEHDYPLWQTRWQKLLALADGVQVSMAQVWPSAEQWRTADVIIFYSNNPGWNAARAPELDAFLQRGGGLVYLHYAVDGHNDVEALADRIGLAWRGFSKFRHGALDLKWHSHPLAEGLGKLDLIDESYWQLAGNEKNIELLASGIEDGQARPLIWTRQQGKGRVFVSIPGHYTWTFDDPLFRMLLLRGICWSAHQPMDRLSELATIGARIAE